MSKINFVFLPHHNSGGHFVLWSMYYLSGQLQHWNGQEICSVPEPNDVIQGKNAHQHNAVRARGLQDCLDLIKKSQSIDVPAINVYVTPIEINTVISTMYNTNRLLATADQIRICDEIVVNDTKMLIDFLQKNYQFSFVKYTDHDRFNVIYNDRCPCDDLSSAELNSIDNKLDLWQQRFYNNTAEHFDKEIWDRREQLALIINTEPPVSFDHMIDFELPNLTYTTDDVWNDLPNVMLELLDYYQLPLEKSHWIDWKQAYYVWREKHDNHFSRCFDQIIEAIVNNHYMSLSRFNLNFYKEMLIQNALITRYNLNLKTWQLIKFPNNTQDLHELLEPNIHTL